MMKNCLPRQYFFAVISLTPGYAVDQDFGQAAAKNRNSETPDKRNLRMHKITHPAAGQPVLLKDLLRRLNISLTLRRKLKQSPGAILVNDEPAAWLTTVNPGDTVTILWPGECRVPPSPLPLAIVYEDESLLVIDKPAGLLVHPTSGPPEPTLANAVVHHLSAGQHRPGGFHPLHRLDRNTSGLILIAKNPHVQHLLSGDGGKQITREYLALVSGAVRPAAGIIDAPIGRRPGSIIERMVNPDGQPATTLYETVRVLAGHCLLKLKLETGRTHQIRVHLAHIGHPILGDDLYGGSTEHIQRQALHAARLRFTHPLTGEQLDLSAPLPADMAGVLSRLAAD